MLSQFDAQYGANSVSKDLEDERHALPIHTLNR